MRVVLASQSPYRKAQLERFGFTFSAVPPRVDEEQLKSSGPQDPAELTRFLALAKARSLSAEFPDALIIGSDQIAEFEGDRLDKPGTKEKALQQLRRMAGRSHQLITSVAVVLGKSSEVSTTHTRIHLRSLQDSTIEAYLELDTPYDCAGAYKIERAGLGLIDSVEGPDPSAIEGLPLIGLTHCLIQLGLRPQNLWRKK